MSFVLVIGVFEKVLRTPLLRYVVVLPASSKIGPLAALNLKLLFATAEAMCIVHLIADKRLY